jgi:protein SCO1/2
MPPRLPRTILPKSRLRLAFLALSPLLAACQSQGPPAAPSTDEQGAASTGTKQGTYPLTGVVREVDRAGGFVTIRHEDIPGLMPAMTMPFAVPGGDIPASVQPGDRVSATLQVKGSDYTLSDLKVIESQAEPVLRLDTSGGTANLRPELPVLKPGDSVPDFSMTTQDGQPLKLSDLRGHVVVLTFIYTRCPVPNFCPLMDRKFGELAAMIQPIPDRANRVRLLSVSFDPEHDTPEALTAHARLRGAREPLWTFAVASHEELRKVAEPLGLKYGPTPNEIIHNLSTAVIGPDGRLARLESGNTWTPEDLHKTIVGLLPGVVASGGPTGSR